MIASERWVTPKLLEVKKVYQYLRFKDLTPDDANKFTLELTSKYFHKTITDYTVAAVFTGGQDDKAGRTVLTEKVPNLAPGEKATFTFNVPAGKKKDMFILVFPSKKDSLVQYKLVEEADPVGLLKANKVEEARKYAVAYEAFTAPMRRSPPALTRLRSRSTPRRDPIWRSSTTATTTSPSTTTTSSCGSSTARSNSSPATAKWSSARARN